MLKHRKAMLAAETAAKVPSAVSADSAKVESQDVKLKSGFVFLEKEEVKEKPADPPVVEAVEEKVEVQVDVDQSSTLEAEVLNKKQKKKSLNV